MATETELKLQLHPHDTDSLLNHPLLNTPAVANTRVQQPLYNTYYDTPDCLLRQHKTALRVRRKGAQWLQTIKGGGNSHGGLHQRAEWEVSIADKNLDFSRFPTEALSGILVENTTREAIVPAFTTEFQRTTWQLENSNGDKLELCLDQGQVSHEQGVANIHEIELELLAGQPCYLYEIALQLLEAMPLVIETGSKAQRGYQLMGLNQQVVAHAPANLSIDSKTDLFEQIFAAQISQIHRNQTAMQDGDTEAFAYFAQAFALLDSLCQRYPAHHLAQQLIVDCQLIHQQCQNYVGQQQLNTLLTPTLQQSIAFSDVLTDKHFNRFLLTVGQLTAV